MLEQITPTPTPSPIVDPAMADLAADQVRLILVFGGAALFLVLISLLHRNWGRRGRKVFVSQFGRVYGLIVIATLAAALALSAVDDEAKSGAFALLGTIAGYLAASSRITPSPGTTPPPSPPTNGNGEGDGEALDRRAAPGPSEESEGPL